MLISRANSHTMWDEKKLSNNPQQHELFHAFGIENEATSWVGLFGCVIKNSSIAFTRMKITCGMSGWRTHMALTRGLLENFTGGWKRGKNWNFNKIQRKIFKLFMKINFPTHTGKFFIPNYFWHPQKGAFTFNWGLMCVSVEVDVVVDGKEKLLLTLMWKWRFFTAKGWKLEQKNHNLMEIKRKFVEEN